MKVLVTGGAGFIGSHVVDQLLADGHTVIVVDNLSSGSIDNLPDDVTLNQVDVRYKDLLASVFAAEKPDMVCHQAAQMSVSRSVVEPGFDASVNIMGLVNCLELSQRYGVQRFVFASSGGVLYGDVSEPVQEHYPANPISPYGISKWTGERYLEFFSREHGLETVALRYSNVYGPRQNPHGEAGVVAIFCQRMLQAESTRINGDGKYIRDYVYVEDVARANFLALTSPLPQLNSAFNVGTGISTDVNQLSAQVYDLCQKALQQADNSLMIPMPEHGPARPGDLRSNLVDASLISERLGWSIETDLETGLKQTVDWFATQADN